MRKILFILFAVLCMSLTSCAPCMVEETFYPNVELVYISNLPYYYHGGRYLPYRHHMPAPHHPVVVRHAQPRSTVTVHARTRLKPQGPRVQNMNARPSHSNGKRR